MEFQNRHSAEASCSSPDQIQNPNSLAGAESPRQEPTVLGISSIITVNADSRTINEDSIIIGNFCFPINVCYPSPPQCFLSSAFRYAPKHTVWPPTLSTTRQEELKHSGYDQSEIKALNIFWSTLCAKCLQWGHHKRSCPARTICLNCYAPGHKALCCPAISDIQYQGMAFKSKDF